MGGLFEWLDLFPQEILTEPVDESRTRVTVFSFGYGQGAQRDRVFEETKKSNIWFLGSS